MQDLAYCGLICSRECPAYQGTLHDDSQLLELIADAWSSSECHYSSEDMFCHGCTSGDRPAKVSSDCEVRACANQKGFRSCGYCPEYPCDVLEALWHSLNLPQARRRLDEIRLASSTPYF